jgi:hypothetical protein
LAPVIFHRRVVDDKLVVQPYRHFVADKPIGEWNTFRIKMVGDKVTVSIALEAIRKRDTAAA